MKDFIKITNGVMIARVKSWEEIKCWKLSEKKRF